MNIYKAPLHDFYSEALPA